MLQVCLQSPSKPDSKSCEEECSVHHSWGTGGHVSKLCQEAFQSISLDAEACVARFAESAAMVGIAAAGKVPVHDPADVWLSAGLLHM